MAAAKASPSTRYFTQTEVANHNVEDDLWVSALGDVLDLTPLIQKYRVSDPLLTRPIIRAAGTDISHWFDPKTRDVLKAVDPTTGMEAFFTPMGRFVHIPPPMPTTFNDTSYDVPWWKDPKYRIGRLTKKPRLVRIVNTLNHHEVTLEVCSEETIAQVKERYLAVNAHASSYIWKRLGDELDMNKTLAENGMEDESDELEEVGLASDFYVPAIHIYFADDLTVA